jgi:arylsulfatase A-like enzyme/tetratricopeptide (TPR) repeat protein
MSAVNRGWLLFALALAGCKGPAPRAGQNVLVITIDTLRADRLGAYGYSRARTPSIDRLASEGVLFEDVVVSIPVTLPSHASLFTGLAPPTHGVRDNTYFRLDSEAETLAELLKARGYETAAFVSAYVLDSSFGLAQGFDVYDDDVPTKGETPGTVAERRGEEGRRAFESWIEKRSPERPFFAWLHFFDPHLPYAPPAPYPAGYDGEVEYADAQVGAALQALERKGLSKNTLVVLTSDHGESLGEHGERSHGFFVYDATLRVPLIMKSASSLPSGKRVAAPVRAIDVMPTILEALAIPAGGRSLLPLVRGEESESPPAYAECYVSELNFGWAPLVALRDGGYKYIQAPRPELYDLASDPGETKNLAGEDSDRVERMRQRLSDIVQSIPASFSSRSQPDPETVARLRSLGYAASGGTPVPAGAPLADPKDRLPLWTRLEEVILHRGAGEDDKAIEAALDVLKEDPTNLLALELLAGVRTDVGDRTKAIDLYRRILAIDGRRPLSHVLLGNLLWQTGDLAGAEASFRAALDSDPDFGRAHRRLGELQLTRGETEPALASFRRASELSGDDVETRLGLARSLMASGQAAEAIGELEALERENPGNPKILAEYAGSLARDGEVDRALTLLAAAPDHHDVHYTASVILRAQDRMSEALAEIERALALEPRSAVALHDRGVLLSRMGRFEDAVSSLKASIEIQDNPVTRNSLGTALCRMDLCAEGVSHFERAVAAAPNYVDALENLAQAYAMLGRERDAEKARKRAGALKGRPIVPGK